MRLAKILAKLLKILLIAALVAAGLALFVRVNGVQYALAFATRGFGKPYFNPAEHAIASSGEATPRESGPIAVMTYNVLCRVCEKDGFDDWTVRIPQLRDTIERYDPDLLGLQELGGKRDVEEFLVMFPQFRCVSYEFGPWTYADAALFYRADRFEALDSGQMWLGPKPRLPFGFAWKPLSVPRYVNWVYLRQKSNDFRFLFVNTHFDNNAPNKEPSAFLFADTFRAVAAQTPIVATGDFNTDLTTQRYQNLQRGTAGEPVFADTMELAAAAEVVGDIPPGKDPIALDEFTNLTRTIDHILVAGPLRADVVRWVQDASVYGSDGRWPSDHPAVFAEIDLCRPDAPPRQ